MVNVDIGELVLNYYRGEMSGEESFTSLLSQYTTPYQQYFLGSCLQLETETKARLRPIVQSLGLPLYESEQARIDGRAITSGMVDLSWNELTLKMAEALEHFTALFEEAHENVPEDCKDLTRSMVEHERALLVAFQKESAGQSEGALDEIILQLKYPLNPIT